MTTDALHLTAAITLEGEWYVARCLQVEVVSQGETIEESLENLREALELYFEDALAPRLPTSSPPPCKCGAPREPCRPHGSHRSRGGQGAGAGRALVRLHLWRPRKVPQRRADRHRPPPSQPRPGTLRSTLRQANWTVEDLEEHLK
ncbi:type II toxin-antitoxin system HicB family antitoxin [Streptomyces sp. NPDC051320]|uniref:type II toxin-antitoxin system HicB family antitoxin n=1 Tax=Streptomyces sp. NPDC051320 TaxID=3154644 RepID=UPI00342F28BD